jgi:hypothetical protein
MVPNGERQRAEQGLREALDRLDSRINNSTTGDPLVPFAEALGWAYSLEEWHESQLRAIGIDYYVRRDNDPDGKVTAGVIYARGLVVHQLASVSLLVGLYSNTYRSDYGPYEQRWRPFSELPPPEKKETHGRDKKYEDHVQSQPIVGTMRKVERFLTATVTSYYP